MEIHAVCPEFIVFSAPTDNHIGKSEAEQLIRELLNINHIPQWSSICIDIFTGDENALFFAYPLHEIKLTLAPYALPFLEQYFTE